MRGKRIVDPPRTRTTNHRLRVASSNVVSSPGISGKCLCDMCDGQQDQTQLRRSCVSWMVPPWCYTACPNMWAAPRVKLARKLCSDLVSILAALVPCASCARRVRSSSRSKATASAFRAGRPSYLLVARHRKPRCRNHLQKCFRAGAAHDDEQRGSMASPGQATSVSLGARHPGYNIAYVRGLNSDRGWSLRHFQRKATTPDGLPPKWCHNFRKLSTHSLLSEST